MSLQHLITEAQLMLGENGVITQPADMAAYTTSMRHRHQRPAAAVFLPRSTEQVAKLVHFCRKQKIAYVPQGGNTGLVDGGLPRPDGVEVIINLSRMNTVREIDRVGMIATVEAGVVLQALHDAVAAEGLMFPLHIASEGSAEIGGLISANAGGSAALRYGIMRHQLLGVEAVLPTGQVISNLKSLVKDNTGYHLAGLLAGAEGTLGIITAATLRLLPAVRNKLTAVIALPDIRAGLRLLALAQREAAEHLSAFEFMSLASLQIVMRNVTGARFPANQQDAPFYILMELSASSTSMPLREMFEAMMSPALENGTAIDAVVAENETQAMQFWHAREHIPEALRVEKQRIHFDIALPLKVLADFMEQTSTLLLGHYPTLTLMPFGHIGDGNVHYNMYFATPFGADEFVAVKEHIHDIVMAGVDRWQGSISAEHGIGVERKEILAELKSKTEMDLMRAIKHALDPENLCNPGKIFD